MGLDASAHAGRGASKRIVLEVGVAAVDDQRCLRDPVLLQAEVSNDIELRRAREVIGERDVTKLPVARA